MSEADPFLMPDANVLDNCFGETNPYKLQEYETFFSGLRICELINEPTPSHFDYDLLKRIHAYIFQDIYPTWAGNSRTIKISKKERLLNGKSVEYKHPGKEGSEIEARASQIFQELQKNNCYKGLNRSQFCEKLASFLSKLWQIHPFREGNTRSTMIICYYIAQQAGYPISLLYIDKMYRKLRRSLVLSTIGKPKYLRQFLYKSITYKSPLSIEYWRNLLKIRNVT